jgi:hypothetical protein
MMALAPPSSQAVRCGWRLSSGRGQANSGSSGSAAAALRSVGRARPGVNAGPCPGTTTLCQCKNPLALGRQRDGAGCTGVIQRTMIRPPQAGEHDHLLGGAHRDAHVLGRTSCSGQQMYRRGQVCTPSAVRACQGSPVVESWEAVHRDLAERGDVQRVVDMTVARHDVGDVAGREARFSSGSRIAALQGTIPGSELVGCAFGRAKDRPPQQGRHGPWGGRSCPSRAAGGGFGDATEPPAERCTAEDSGVSGAGSGSQR